MSSRIRRWVWLPALMLVLAGCGSGGPEAGSEAFPSATAEDWVTYGDYFLELTAVSEVTLEPDQKELFEGEGLFRRQFALTVDRVLWRRPGVTHPPPTEHTSVSGGWQFKNGNLDKRKRVRDRDQLSVGGRYVGIFTHDGLGAAEGGDEWWCFTRLPVTKGRLGRVDSRAGSGSVEILEQLRGSTPEEAGALLTRTPPDPAVVPFLDKDARDRYQLKAAAARPSATPAEGER